MLQSKNMASQPAQAMTPAQQSPSGSSTPRPKGPPLHKIYELPAPIRTFPLPSFYPNNPISLFHVLYAWTKQSLFPPPAEPSIVHEGIWSPESKSVNVINEKSMRALWEQGFYGKGNLSRSEPNWLKREQVRRGLVPGQVSELVTANRREERRQMKWDRAKTEQEAIRQLRLQEAQLATQVPAVDTVKSSTLVSETEGLSPKPTAETTHNPEREASTDAEPLPVSAVPPKSVVVESNQVAQTGAPDVTKDITEVITEPETSDLSLENPASTLAKDTATGQVNGSASHVTQSRTAPINPSGLQQECVSHIDSAKIAKPSDFLRSVEEAGIITKSDVFPEPDDTLSAPISVTWVAPTGPSELLSLPNSQTSVVKVGTPENISGSVNIVIDREVVIQPSDLLPGTISPCPPAPTGPLELLHLPNSGIRPFATFEHVEDVAVDGQSEQSEQDVVLIEEIEVVNNPEPEVVTEPLLRSSLVNGTSATSSALITTSPVGPLELLSLPNAHSPVINGTSFEATNASNAPVNTNFAAVPQKLSTIHEDAGFGGSKETQQTATEHLINDLVNGINGNKTVHAYGLNGTADPMVASADPPATPKSVKRRKSVRFSPKVESTTYQLSDPPSPSHALLNGINGKATPPLNGASLGPSVLETETKDATTAKDLNSLNTVSEASTANDTNVLENQTDSLTQPDEVVNKEHLQLTSEEAFFLAFGMGALRVVNPATKAPIPTADLFNLFRQYSYFPSRASEELQPDDGFLVNYAVYHHFRSLGWVPRAGIKFGVDWMLYAKGPVFDHAEFGVIILPSYSHKWWKDSNRQLPRKTWHWLHGVVRVLSHVQKSLVLVYVDVPPPPEFDEALKKGPAEVFKLYKIREVMVKRWSSNRNR